MIETALITVPSRANDLIFGRPLLERLLILCEREGIRRFVLETPSELRTATRVALGRFRDDPAVTLVDALNPANPGLDPAAVGVRLDGN
ncbi:MAG TPA: hypothetical protein VNU00_01940, partial [Candidatus Binataceae bacterium]|nr:hypothetical protein [Candidatus Binataceae bacterium]